LRSTSRFASAILRYSERVLSSISYLHFPSAAVPSLPLAGWLSTLASRGADEILLGATGHLMLREDEEENVATQLRKGVLPRLFAPGGPSRACMLTGLAPGSDLLFARVVSSWLLEREIPFRIIGLLPVPTSILLQDWLDRLREAGQEVSPAQHNQRRRQIESTLLSCEAVVDMLPAGTRPSDLQRRSIRERQYRRLAACLAERSDILVAILRDQNLLKPGGTAEVVDWRRHPQHIPPEFRTAARPLDTAAGHRLIVIDPAVEYTAEESSPA